MIVCTFFLLLCVWAKEQLNLDPNEGTPSSHTFQVSSIQLYPAFETIPYYYHVEGDRLVINNPIRQRRRRRRSLPFGEPIPYHLN